MKIKKKKNINNNSSNNNPEEKKGRGVGMSPNNLFILSFVLPLITVIKHGNMQTDTY